MIYPTIEELTKNKFNRYELAIATAKCARAITNEHTKQCELAEKAQFLNRESDKPVMSSAEKECKEEKSVKNAINKIYNGSYVIVRVSNAENGEKEFN